MAFGNCFSDKDVVSPESMSYIVISVKNCEGTEGYHIEFLFKEAVERVIVEVEKRGKNRKIVNEVKAEDDDEDEGKTKYTHSLRR
jgi:hypothetical protein